MPELKFKSLDEIPEGLREGAKQNGSEFVVNVVPANKLNEFRDNNVRLLQERDSLKAERDTFATIVGDDPKKFQTELGELKSIAQQVKDGKLKGSDAIEAEVLNRSKAAVEQLQTQLAGKGTELQAAVTERDGWKSKYERSVLHQRITNAVVGKDSVANPEALPDILTRAESVFQVQADGSVVPKKDGVIIYGSDGATPMSEKEWLTKLVGEAPYLGKPSAGGGANGGKGDNKFGVPDAEFQKLSPSERISRFRQAQGR